MCSLLYAAAYVRLVFGSELTLKRGSHPDLSRLCFYTSFWPFQILTSVSQILVKIRVCVFMAVVGICVSVQQTSRAETAKQVNILQYVHNILCPGWPASFKLSIWIIVIAWICTSTSSPTWANPGGGGVQGVRTPPSMPHDVGFITLGPKLDPLLDPSFLLVESCRPKIDRPPLFKKCWIRPCPI